LEKITEMPIVDARIIDFKRIPRAVVVKLGKNARRKKKRLSNAHQISMPIHCKWHQPSGQFRLP
jgi:hypothetical protein